MIFSDRLKELRQLSGLSTVELAKLTGMSQSAISKLENGQRRIDLEALSVICTALGVTLYDFFAGKEPAVPTDLQQLIETAKKLTPEERKKVTDMLQTILGRVNSNE
ncbi:transcriptional regulator [Brevibacillus phage Jimmer1]|uniref:Transcriptional regulator n=2 Tax=Jimmervirus jimmer TaxID=1984789 RepID=S5MTQ6_9CAUD|nr:transcriptional regulator [Brevibacillus phage Jimmer1]YP_009606488.1 transcriptional regulator [Brevibacillus phage Jimmer2]AGR47197.1 transcriptional regulator [Brevibacillus phage Jimmer2]AGR47297.1 transcriptional regulator [Brevibacillus phage Jimmer1]